MARTSPVHYINPSNISITPNANESAHDLAVYISRGAKIKVFSESFSELGYTGDNTWHEWTIAGRNRRLSLQYADSPFTIYARLHKTNSENGYIVFTPKTLENGVWKDKYPYVTFKDGLAKNTMGAATGDYWYIRLGDVSAPLSGERTVNLDTGILGTDQFNAEWNLDPDDMPLRVTLSSTIDAKDAGTTPFVPWGKFLRLHASLLEGWVTDASSKVSYWTITRNTGDPAADALWPDDTRAESFAATGNIELYHIRDGVDDFMGNVSAIFTVTAWGVQDSDSSDSDSSDSGSSGGEIVALASASLSIMAETECKYELILSKAIVSYSPMKETYDPADGVTVRVRANDQKSSVFDLTVGQLQAIGLRVYYAQARSEQWTQLTFSGASSAIAEATIPVTAWYAQKDIVVRITNSEGKEVHRSTISFMFDDGESLENFVNITYEADKENLQNQIDGKYETYFFAWSPSLTVPPVMNDAAHGKVCDNPWLTGSETPAERTAILDSHVSDLYWDKAAQNAYRFVKNDDDTYSWAQIGDSSVIAAMAAAAEAQDTADGKRRVFTQQPAPPYDAGDLWTQGTNGDLMVCVSGRQTGTYQAADWAKATKYTDDSYAHGFDYLKEAMQGDTQITGGLVLSNLLMMRNTQSGVVGDVTAGINGIINPTLGLRTIAAWYGGDMEDIESVVTPDPNVRYAKSLFRHDGSGYMASGKISWNAQGAFTKADFSGVTTKLNVIGIGDTTINASDLLVLLDMFEIVTENNVEFVHVKNNRSFYSDGDISALGRSSGGGGGGGGASVLYELNDVLANAAGTGVLDAQAGYVLTCVANGTGLAWKAAAVVTSLAGLSDVSIGSQTDGQVLGWDAAQLKWVPKTVSPGTTYEAMTAAEINTGTSTTSRVITSKVLNDWWKRNLNPLTLSDLTLSSTFAIGDTIAIRGTIYRCTAATSKMPFTPIVQNSKMLYNELNGKRSYIFEDMDTLNTGWEVWLDTNLDYDIEWLRKEVEGLRTKVDQSFDDMATKSWVRSQGYVTSSALSGYATQSWVGSQGYLTSSSVINSDATLYYNTRTKIAQIGTQDIYVTMPASGGGGGGIAVRNTLDSTSTTDALSAYMGYLLARGSARDDTKVAKTGDTMSGNLIINAMLGIGVSSPSYALHVSGTIYATNDITAASDARLKDVVEDAVLTVEQIANAPAVKFRWKDGRDSLMHAGTIAQYWQKVMPEVVVGKAGILPLNYGAAAMVSVINVAKKVVDHEQKIAQLEAQAEKFRQCIEVLEREVEYLKSA